MQYSPSNQQFLDAYRNGGGNDAMLQAYATVPKQSANAAMFNAYSTVPRQSGNADMFNAYRGGSTNEAMLNAFRRPPNSGNEAMMAAYRTVPNMDLDMFGGNGGPEWAARRANNAMRAAYQAQMQPDSLNAAMADAFYNQPDYDNSPNAQMRRAYYASTMPFAPMFPPVMPPLY